MKVVVINGTELKGCTYHMKELFLDSFRNESDITEFYLPKDLPEFCCGCKTCFLKDERLCPHSKYTMPIWNAMLDADLLLFAYPVYALRTTGQMKVLLDHFCCHWMVHRPDQKMFHKRAVILTQSIGAPNGAAQKDVATSLTWLGVSDIRKFSFGTMGVIKWDDFSDERRRKIEASIVKFSKKCRSSKSVRQNIKVKTLFMVSKLLHKSTLKNEEVPSADNQHWIDNGWIKR